MKISSDSWYLRKQRNDFNVRVALQKTHRICGHNDDAMYQGIGLRRSSEARTQTSPPRL